MKKIIIKSFDKEWIDSELDYDKELKRLKNEDLYLALRNSSSTVNSYAIIDLKSEGDGSYASCEFKFRGHEHWDRIIVQFCYYFEKQFTTKPNILIANLITLKKIEDITGAAGAMEVFKSHDFELKICVDINLPDDMCKILHDEKEKEETKVAHKHGFENIIEHETLMRRQRIINSLQSLEIKSEEPKVTLEMVFNEVTKARNNWTQLFKKKSIHDSQDLYAYFEEMANSLFFLHLKISTVYSAAIGPEIEKHAVEKWDELLYPSFVVVNEFFENFEPGKYSSNEDYAYLLTKDPSFLDTLPSILILYHITNSIKLQVE